MRKGEGGVFFVPGFPVMAWPMIEWVLDTRLRRPACASAAPRERSVIVFGAMEAALTPLMEAIESGFPGIKVFSLPSVDHPDWGRHIELGVKGDAAKLDAAYRSLLDGLKRTRRQAWPRIGAIDARRVAPDTVRSTHRERRRRPAMSLACFLLNFDARFWGWRSPPASSKPPPSTARTNLREIY